MQAALQRLNRKINWRVHQGLRREWTRYPSSFVQQMATARTPKVCRPQPLPVEIWAGAPDSLRTAQVKLMKFGRDNELKIR
jgi:hypothetical protein